MSNRLDDLRIKCRNYHLKKGLKAFGIIALLLTLPVSGYYIYDLIAQASIEKKDNPKVQAKIKTEKPVAAEKKTTSPSYLLSVSPAEVEKSVSKIQNRQVLEAPSFVHVERQKGVEPSYSSRPTVKEVSKQTPRKSYFTETNEDKPLEDWIDKYNQKKSYALAIYIAKQYYFDADYKQAGIWAKRANQLDRNKEEAWLLYAKSVYGLGNKEKAVRILKIYLQYKESSKADLLLSEWSD